MTLIELLAIVVWGAFGFAGTLLGLIVGGAQGAAAGLALGVLAVPLLAALVDQLMWRFVRGPAQGPPCLCGSRELYGERDARSRWVARCRCGEVYLREAGAVFRLTPAGASLAHSQWHWRRGWTFARAPLPRCEASYRD